MTFLGKNPLKMGNYTIFGGFENPRRGRQARNLTTNVRENSRSQIVFRTDILQKFSSGAPDPMGLHEDMTFTFPTTRHLIAILTATLAGLTVH